ncbi:hypothetical protein HPP92_028366, partial [Vanilla planifolia]
QGSSIEHIFAALLFIQVLILLLQTILKKSKKNRHQASRQPPGPLNLPLIGNLHLLLGQNPPHRTLRKLSAKYGPIMRLKLGEIPVVVISSADGAAEVMKFHNLEFASWPINYSVEAIFYGGNNILFRPYGDFWRQMRRLCNLKLLSPKRANSGVVVDLSSSLAKVSNNVMARAAICGRCEDQSLFHSLLGTAVKLLSGFNLVDLFPSMPFIGRITGHHRRIQREGGLQFPLSDDNIKAVINMAIIYALALLVGVYEHVIQGHIDGWERDNCDNYGVGDVRADSKPDGVGEGSERGTREDGDNAGERGEDDNEYDELFPNGNQGDPAVAPPGALASAEGKQREMPGRRMCPGMQFGLSTVEMVVAHLLCYFDWEFPGKRGEELDVTEDFGVTRVRLARHGTSYDPTSRVSVGSHIVTSHGVPCVPPSTPLRGTGEVPKRYTASAATTINRLVITPSKSAAPSFVLLNPFFVCRFELQPRKKKSPLE